MSAPFEQLLGWWLGELDADDADDADAIEAHLFGCAACTARVELIAAIAAAVPGAVRRAGGRHMVLTADAVARLERDGVRLRQYRFDANRHVDCTVAPDDDLNVSWIALGSTVRDDERLDAVYYPPTGGPMRLLDVPVERTPDGDRIVMADPSDYLRTLPDCVTRLELVATSSDDGSTRAITTVEFRHSAWR